ncbi:MAG: phosphatidylserine decarboxylase [Methylococcaceae bacterium]|nr:phosphatidylserine decarboxylase [Methylococcaceae bacterium]
MTLKTALSVWPQYVLPHHALSQFMSKLTHCEKTWWKNAFIRLIIKLYRVNLAEARYPDLSHYPNFNAFFTRELAEGVRPINTEARGIACPADGAISQIGRIAQQQIFQAKGHQYVSAVPELFARNERVVCLYETAQGPMALILVGAIFVSSIETVWHGVVTPPTITQARNWDYPENTIQLAKGAEMGRFNMGSTIIVLFGENQVDWLENLTANTPVKLGEAIGHYR